MLYSVKMRVGVALLALCVPLAGAVSACGEDEEPHGETTLEATLDAAPPPPPPPPASDAGGPTGPKVECQIGAALELEPNDTTATATSFTELALCGVLETSKDVDYLAFETPPGTKLAVFQAVITGTVDFELTSNGKTFTPSDTEQFGPGKYLVKVFTKSAEPGSYKLRVQFDPE